MSKLSGQELLHHFQAMKRGTAAGPFELAPWQEDYGSMDAAHNEQDAIDDLITRLSQVLDTVTGVGNVAVIERNTGLMPEAADAWCLRGKDAVLDLVVLFLDCLDEEHRSYRISFINQVSHRLRSLKLVGHKFALYEVAKGWTMPAPQLRKLELKCHYCNCQNPNIPSAANTTVIRAPESLPSLHSLTISPIHFALQTIPALEGLLSASLPVLSLYLEDSLPALASTLRLLASAPNIQDLDLRNVRFCENAHAECTALHGLEPVYLPGLEILRVSTRYGSDKCFKWLRLLHAPSLKTVNINGSEKWQKELPPNRN
ncbi:hypothetical protein CALCODRAFT_510314 [Calocera cornea HHB12733]|uniref:F-box domain-containing protein n=1 Tax=Calocera cornea HHB12733 TaxID=1353952 RepID=A0A165EKV4_9BASI|nr:hypothetical protein CALCODRAFT_510314 [Calocera cornea HHB12733]